MKRVGIKAADITNLPCSAIDSKRGTVTLLAELFLQYLEQRSDRVCF